MPAVSLQQDGHVAWVGDDQQDLIAQPPIGCAVKPAVQMVISAGICPARVNTPFGSARVIAACWWTVMPNRSEARCRWRWAFSSSQFPGGRCAAAVGPSVTGKTTLLRLLNRLDEPAAAHY